MCVCVCQSFVPTTTEEEWTNTLQLVSLPVEHKRTKSSVGCETFQHGLPVRKLNVSLAPVLLQFGSSLCLFWVCERLSWRSSCCRKHHTHLNEDEETFLCISLCKIKCLISSETRFIVDTLNFSVLVIWKLNKFIVMFIHHQSSGLLQKSETQMFHSKCWNVECLQEVHKVHAEIKKNRRQICSNVLSLNQLFNLWTQHFLHRFFST